MSIPLIVILAVEDGELAPYLTPGQEPDAMARIEVVGCLPAGMESGLPSFVAVIELPDGRRILAETSWRNMSLALVALAARWGHPVTAPPLDDQSLAALAFLEAIHDGNKINWGHMLDTTSSDDLIVGLARVGATLAHELAVNTGSSLGEVFEVHRALFLHYGNPR